MVARSEMTRTPPSEQYICGIRNTCRVADEPGAAYRRSMRALLGAIFLAACSADSFIAADAAPLEEGGHFGAPVPDGGPADVATSSDAGLSDAFAADAGSDADPPPADASWGDSADSGSGWGLGDLAYCSGISCAWTAWPLTQGEP